MAPPYLASPLVKVQSETFTYAPDAKYKNAPCTYNWDLKFTIAFLEKYKDIGIENLTLGNQGTKSSKEQLESENLHRDS